VKKEWLNSCHNMMCHILLSMLMNSIVILELPNSHNICPTFYTSKILPYIESDTTLFLSLRFEELNPIIANKGDEEFYSTLKDMDAVINILSVGTATVKSMTNGCLVQNCKVAKCWTSGWPHRRDLLYLR
jgi:hypothetical protein